MGNTDEEPDDLHDWLSFEHEGVTWCFDLTFLLSPWSCIYGAGCLGVLDGPAAHLEQGCCTYGAHFADKDDRRAVEARIATLTDDDWQLRSVAEAAGGAVQKNSEGEWTTLLHESACVLLNRPGFAAGAGCALHQAALRSGERPIDWKPAVCWQLPLRLEESVDSNEHVTYTLREWKRRDWGAGGLDFHWWCTDGPEAFVGSAPVWVTLRDEIVELVGEGPYAMLARQLDRRQAVGSTAYAQLKVRRKRSEGGMHAAVHS